MNIEETKECIRVMQAFVDGKDLEVLGLVGKWEPVYFPRWGWDDTKYRIKPTYVLRPWTADEVPLGAWMRKKQDVPHRWVVIDTGNELWRQAWFEDSEHSIDCGKTWLPCGVMEESK
jgi:hypothetical protein